MTTRIAPSQRSKSAPWHAVEGAAVSQTLAADPVVGLSPQEAARRLQEHGPNSIPQPPGRSALRMFLDQFSNLLVGILLGAIVLSVVVGEIADAIAILAIVVVNAVIGFVQERRAADALAALRKMTAPSARVKRGGAVAIVPAGDLVPGDFVILEAGDHVPADLRFIRTSALRTVEAALTGESEPVGKHASPLIEQDAPLAERRNMGWMGTIVAAGAGEGLVVATGAGTEFGRIAELVRTAEEEETPLQARLRVFGKWLVLGSGSVVLLVFGLGLLRGVPVIEMLLSSVSLAVAAVPEGLPAVVTIALALGVQRMARKRSLVRKLASVETLGSTTVICSDKTGTLTVGQMTVREVRTFDDQAAFEGEGYRPEGRILRNGIPVTLAEGEPLSLTLWAALACSTARLVERDATFDVAGDPTEGALLVAARKAAMTPEAVESREPLISILPFDSDRKRMSCLRRRSCGERSYVKGAPEMVLPRCLSVRARDWVRAMGPEDRARIEQANEDMARQGLRVLAVALREVRPGDDPESDLVFLGLVGMQDPPRAEAKEAVATCREAGIRPIMVTGDHPRTAFAIAKALGMAHAENEVLTGREIEAMDDAALAGRVEAVSVYARVSPEHKLRIVRAWKTKGAVVAMTGDGVNDAPALKGADIGIAMGRTGTDVAKEASSMVITDDNFATIVTAVEQGRAIFENIRKTLLYLLSGNTAEILVMGVAVVAGLPLPLVPIQLLWINLVTDGFPALALATDPPEEDLLNRRPRKPGAEIADRDFITWMLASGSLVALTSLAGFLWGLYGQDSLERARTYAFSILVMGEVLKSFAFRSQTRILWEVGAFSNLRLAVIAAATVGLQIGSHHVPFLESFLKTGALTWSECLFSVVLAFVPVTVLELWKLFRRGMLFRFTNRGSHRA